MTTPAQTTRWTEVGERVFVRRYRFYDQNIVAVLAGDEESALVVDTRTHPGAGARDAGRPARPRRAAGRASSSTRHGHYDHAFGNQVFRPAVDLGSRALPDDDPSAPVSASCAGIARRGPAPRGRARRGRPRSAGPGVRRHVTTLDLGGREVRLRPTSGAATRTTTSWSRSPTPTSCAPATCSRTATTPYFGDGYPMDWPATVEAMLPMVGRGTAVVPGHGDVAGRVVRDRVAGRHPVDRRAGRRGSTPATLDLEAVIAASPYPPGRRASRWSEPLAQLRGADARPEPRPAVARRGLPGDADHPAPACLPIDDRVQRGLQRVEVDLRDRRPRCRAGAGRSAIRCQSARRGSIGMFAESMPRSATPRRMNGRTVVVSSAPLALPEDATAPPIRSVRRT